MFRIFRSLLPFILASLGFAIILSTTNMPLFEWQISGIVTDFPSTYDVNIEPSPWTAHLGDSLDDGSYIFSEVFVQKDGKTCSKEDLNFVVRRSQSDEALERVLNFNQKNTLWLFEWNMIDLILSGIYIWWFTIWYEHRSVSFAVIFTMIAVFIFIFLTQIVREIAGPLNHIAYFGTMNCAGTVSFNAVLSKVHYETLAVLFAGTLLELGALGVMVRQVMKAIVERRSGSKLTENSPE